jgi:hypothetical protein
MAIVRNAAKEEKEANAAINYLGIESIVLHFLYTGEFDMAQTLIAEARSPFHSNMGELTTFFKKVHAIDKQLDNTNGKVCIDEAILWVLESKEDLNRIHSPLLFHLHKLNFLQLVHDNNKAEAVAYAREHLAQLSLACNEKEMGSLMSVLVLMEQQDITLAANNCRMLFKRDMCFLKGIPARSPLETCLEAGELCIGQLRNYYKLCENGASSNKTLMPNISVSSPEKHNSEEDAEKPWVDLPELPVSVVVPDKMIFHSSLVCPVTKVPTNATNFPVLLTCGHVVSNDSLNSMTNNGGWLKCPTCTADQNLAESQRMDF